MGRLAGVSVVITGGASGIGRAAAALFLEHGANVVVGDLNEEQGRALVDEMEDRGHRGRMKFLRCNVSIEADVEALVGMSLQSFGRLDVMFNNAGIEGAFGPITEIDADHWDRTFAINTRGVFLGLKHAAKVMIRQNEGGSIINTASLAGLTSGAGAVVYSASKAAVIRLGQSAALELGRHRIRVNTICPGVVFTPLMHRGKPDRADAVMRAAQPLPFRGEPEHIAHAALYLASAESAFVTGICLTVDGGLLTVGPLAETPMVSPSPERAGMMYGTTGQKADVRTVES